EMRQRGAKPGDLGALLAATGAQTETIPPSLVLITIGSVTGVSISALFTGGEGLGVALESTLLAERELACGRLVAPLAGRANDIRYVGHRLIYPRASRQRSSVRAFADWVVAQLQADHSRRCVALHKLFELAHFA
ncbi:LysR substrate-binding domain-containing protein, partial [Bradyrhizobium ottawaense]|uniref:LysR substrate-binding domain-containing protein n=1 Tax=Bradyrhizobium ottawaense TaxID=931866 RepID=UPI0030C6AFAD